MITGLNLNLSVGSLTVTRSPYIGLTFQRGAVASRAVIILPDPQGLAAKSLKNEDPVDLFFGYRGGHSQSWAGKVTLIEPQTDQVKVTALGPELVFIKTKVVECFRNESARAVIRRLMGLAGVSPGRLEGPDNQIPHLIFSGQSVESCFRQINETLSKTYQLDLTKSPYWIGADGQGHWGDFDEPGPGFVLASQDNLISHDPCPKDDSGQAQAMLCPGLMASQLFTVKDARRSSGVTRRALMVRHEIKTGGNLTTVTYGPENGY